MFPSLVLIVFSAWVSVSAADLSSEFAHHAVLDPQELMKLYWTVDWDLETISFAVEAATTGWVGVGFSSGNGRMVGSDVVIGWVKDSKGYLTDRFADEKRLPPLDEEQNYELTGFEESDTKTVLKFYRKFDTCDPRDRAIKQGTTKVVFAYHTEDPKSGDDIARHTFFGSRSILLLNKMDERQVNETGWKDFLMHKKNITIPKKPTTYWCSLIKAPAEITTKHHITKFEPYVQKGNEGFVHHLVIYECHNRGQFNDSLHYGPGFDCHDYANMPFLECYLYSVVAAWAIGAEAFYYPPNVGYNIGTDDSPNSYMLEIHYDNPKGIEGRKDSSGLRFFYTSNIRIYDAGILLVGEASLPYLVIPPKQNTWLTVGYCPKECSEESLNSTKLPGKGINVFAAFLHTHLQGLGIWTKHVRDGVELPEVARDDNYDFNFQDIQVLKNEVHVKPGDDLMTYCKYQTMDRDKMVVGGVATSQEMCLSMLFYYPRMVKEPSCNSIQYKPVHEFIGKYFPYLKPHIKSLHYNPLVAMNITWTEEMASDLRRGYEQGETLIPTCKHQWEMEPPYHVIPVPKITQPLPPPNSDCQKDIESNSSMKAVSLTLVLSLLGFMAIFL